MVTEPIRDGGRHDLTHDSNYRCQQSHWAVPCEVLRLRTAQPITDGIGRGFTRNNQPTTTRFDDDTVLLT